MLTAKHRTAAVLILALCLSGWSRRAQAQAAPESARSARYYALHGGAITGVLGATLVIHLLVHSYTPGRDFAWFPGDAGLRGQRSASAAELSNQLIVLSLAEPLLVEVGSGVDAHFANASMVYAETVSTNLLLNGLTKIAWRRPRPYTYGVSARDDVQSTDRNLSFYSGHSSTAFAAAISGGLLFAESAPNQASRLVVWGTQLGLAGATANLRVMAGKHYYSDVVVGALVGSGIGIVVPVLHGERYAPKPAEYAAGGGGLLAGLLVTSLLPLHQDSPPNRANVDWMLAPWAPPGGVGAAAVGRF
ncbi:MAG TPA: phosphatase PAP2 family protein [Polyangiaceae bacterium]|nr:phosphatase PAP2 family protein [Polyangiaceae bacterium]